MPKFIYAEVGKRKFAIMRQRVGTTAYQQIGQTTSDYLAAELTQALNMFKSPEDFDEARVKDYSPGSYQR